MDVTHILDDLQWRGLIQDSTDLDELRKRPGRRAGHVLCRLRPDRAEPAPRPPDAGRSPLGGCSWPGTGRWLLVGGRDRADRRPARSRGERTLNPPEVVGRLGRRGSAASWSRSSTSTGRQRGARWSTTWTGPRRCRRSSSCATSASTSRSTRCWPATSVRNRLETGISFTEFSYQLLQSHDYFELHRRYGCTLQFGGSDQWGNITAGVDYIRRRGAGPVHAFTTPLVTKADGTKFGKTEGGAIWLDPGDDQPVRLLPVLGQHRRPRRHAATLKYFSFRSREEMEALEKETAERPAARAAQRALAEELTTLVHGEEEAPRSIAASRRRCSAGARWTSCRRRRCGLRWPRPGWSRVDGPLPTSPCCSRSRAWRPA